MRFKRRLSKLNFLLSITLIAFLTNCIDPVKPDFNFKDNLIFIDAIASTTSNVSFVKIHESVLIDDHYSTSFVSNANVVFTNTNTSETVLLYEESEIYVPDSDFRVEPGETWELQIILEDGRTYASTPQTILESVPISNITVDYDKELLYREESEDYMPGHLIAVDFTDPSDEENYYYWSYRAFERKRICLQCPPGTIYRNGECEPNPPSIVQYSYGCETDCWRIRFNENIKIFADKFSNGNTINSLPVADIPLYSKEDILVEIQQFSLTASSYEYFKVLKDIIDNSGSINSPPPAAFIGNMFNPNDTDEVVLGRFTAASTSTMSIFIDRTDIVEEIIGGEEFIRFEGDCGIGCIPVTVAPCEESRYSTGIEPEGWIDN